MPPRRALPATAALALLVMLGAACSSTPVRSSSPSAVPGAPVDRTSPSGRTTSAPTQPSKILVIVMENHAYDQVVGNPAMPFLNGTIVPGSLDLTDMHADAHPSLPNYVWMAAGQSCGAASDGDWDRTCTSVFDQLLRAKIPWTVFAEGYPGTSSSCSLVDATGTSSTDYARKHVPPLLFTSTSAGTACTRHVLNFPGDVVADGAAPARSFRGVAASPLTFVVPNLCHDMHDDTSECGAAGGGVEGADRWLLLNWADLLRSVGPDGVVILTWDESDGGDPPIPTFVAGPNIRAGTTDGRRYDHASTLRAIEDALGLPCLAGACDAAPLPITGR